MNWRNKKLLETVRDFPCAFCGNADGTVVAAHSNQIRDGKGKAIKSHDYRIAALCYRCHSELDQGATLSKEERLAMWEEAHRTTMGWLFHSGKVKVL